MRSDTVAQLAASTMSAINYSAKRSRKVVRYRSAKTGKFVKASYAKRYPHLTVGES